MFLLICVYQWLEMHIRSTFVDHRQTSVHASVNAHHH